MASNKHHQFKNMWEYSTGLPTRSRILPNQRHSIGSKRASNWRSSPRWMKWTSSTGMKPTPFASFKTQHFDSTQSPSTTNQEDTNSRLPTKLDSIEET